MIHGLMYGLKDVLVMLTVYIKVYKYVSGTPGRLLDHARNTSNLNLSHVSWLILDEGDKLLDMGYERDVSR